MNLYLFELEWPFIEKLLFKGPLWIKDFPITPEELREKQYGHLFSTITNDINIFAINGKLKFINKPDVTI